MVITPAYIVDFLIGILAPLIVPLWNYSHYKIQLRKREDLQKASPNLLSQLSQDENQIGQLILLPGLDMNTSGIKGKLGPFLRELPSAFISNSIWGGLNPLGKDPYWTYFYIALLLISLFFLNSVNQGSHGTWFKLKLCAFGLFLGIISFLKSFSVIPFMG